MFAQSELLVVLIQVSFQYSDKNVEDVTSNITSIGKSKDRILLFVYLFISNFQRLLFLYTLLIILKFYCFI